MKRFRYTITACLTFVVALGLLSSPASAHTGFESSDPADGAEIETPVDTITLIFTGDAEPTVDGFLALDPVGQVREPAEASTADGRTWVLQFDPPLSGGIVGVRWSVRAPDAHPIDGSFTFSTPLDPDPDPAAAADEPTPDDASAADVAGPDSAAIVSDEASPVDPVLDERDASLDALTQADRPMFLGSGDTTTVAAFVAGEPVELDDFLNTGSEAGAATGRVGAAGRLVALLGTLLGVGGLVFAGTAMRGGREDVRHVLLWVRRAGAFVVAGALVEFAAQVAIEDGGRWSAVSSPSVWMEVIASTFGVAVALRIAGGIALASGARLDTIAASEVRDPIAAVRELVGVGGGAGADVWGAGASVPESGERPGATLVRPDDRAWLADGSSAGAMAGALAIVAAHLFDGHTVTKGNRLFTGIVDVVHVAGGAVWAGGVLMLMSVVWRRHREGRDLRARQLVIRFSVVASAALVVVGVAGVALTFIVLDSPSELWTTAWGRILLAKTAFVGVAAAAGAYNHKVLAPALDAAPGDGDLSRRFRNVITVEALALVAVAVATAFLMGAAS